MLEIFHKSKKADQLVVFVHGLTGSDSTWRNESGKSFPQLLIENETIKDQFDFGFFDYYSKLFSIPAPLNWLGKILSKFTKNKAYKLEKNLHVNEIADLFSTYLSEYAKQYKSIVLICHSMGGLIAKSLIVHHAESEAVKKIKLLISLAVPHNGSILASLGKEYFSSIQIKNLEPLNADINKINALWISSRNTNPKIIYFQGKFDEIVVGSSSIGYDANIVDVKFCDDDHLSIAKPKSSNSLVCVSVKNALCEISQHSIGTLNGAIGDKNEKLLDETVFLATQITPVITAPPVSPTSSIVPVGSRVFISYSHDSDAHRQRVRELADRLVYEGVDCWCDQYVEDGAPERGWPLWMEDNVRAADFVLMVCTELYLNRYEGRELPSRGLGAKFEAVLLTQDMYENDSKNKKIIAVLFEESDKAYIPSPFRPYTHYCLAAESGYSNLYARLTKQIPKVRPVLGTVKQLSAPSATSIDTLVSKQDLINDVQQVLVNEDVPHLPVIPEFTTDTMHPNLKIAQAFFGRPVTTRFAIASKLDLLEPGETPDDINREDVSARILLRAKARGVLDKLWSNLFNESLDPNPFLQ